MEGCMRLALETREVGRVTIVRCSGRIVAGEESESLRAHVAWLLRDRRAIVLHLGDVAFIDSSGLGTMVRALSSTRQVRGDLKLCEVPGHVRKVLELSQLSKLFDAHESEEKAVAAFYGPAARAEESPGKRGTVLCLQRNADVLAYTREVLRSAGYEVHSSGHLGDGLMLLRVARFDLVVAGPEMAAALAGSHAAQFERLGVPVVETGTEFSTDEAGAAGAGLLEKVGARLGAKSA
jgi:anti-anti-sigma factor